MTLQLAISPNTVLEGAKVALERFYATPREEVESLAQRSLGLQAEEVAAATRTILIAEHPLRDIALEALNDLVAHSVAIDRIGNTRAALVHVRHIEEVTAVLGYLVAKPEQYNEFAWRWSAFPIAHGIRNRILNLKEPLEPIMRVWIDANIANMKKVNKKFTGDPAKDASLWEKYSNWLSPVPVKDFFLHTGKLQTFVSELYDWHSQVVHFSPPGAHLLSRGYLELSFDTVSFNLHKVLGLLQPLTTDPDVIRRRQCRLVLLSIFRFVDQRPDQMEKLLQSSIRLPRLFAELLRTPQNQDELANVLVGIAPLDPLVVSVE